MWLHFSARFTRYSTLAIHRYRLSAINYNEKRVNESILDFFSSTSLATKSFLSRFGYIVTACHWIETLLVYTLHHWLDDDDVTCKQCKGVNGEWDAIWNLSLTIHTQYSIQYTTEVLAIKIITMIMRHNGCDNSNFQSLSISSHTQTRQTTDFLLFGRLQVAVRRRIEKTGSAKERDW